MLGSILIVSDDFEAENLWQRKLIRSNFTIKCAGLDNIPQAQSLKKLNLIIFNIEKRNTDAVQQCCRLSHMTQVPIIFLTYQNMVPQLLDIYQAGVVDCIIKPVDFRIVLAKIFSWTKHSTVPVTSRTTTFNGAYLSDDNILTTASNDAIRLSSNEARLLQLLMSNSEIILRTTRIMEYVWGYDECDTSALRSTLHRLRRKLHEHNAQIEIEYVAGQGYVLRSFQSETISEG